MKAALLMLAALAALTASAAPPPPGHERLPVIHLQLDGRAKFETVVVPVPLFDGLLQHVCIREYDATAIRCYVLDTNDDPAWLTFDLNLKQ